MTRLEKLQELIGNVEESIETLRWHCKQAQREGDVDKAQVVDSHIGILHQCLAQYCDDLQAELKNA